MSEYCIPEIRNPNILYTQKPWPTLDKVRVIPAYT